MKRELMRSVKLERETGFEPATLALARRCSTTELFPHPPAEEAGFYRPCVKTVKPPVANIIFAPIYVDSWGSPPSKRTIGRMDGWPLFPTLISLSTQTCLLLLST